MGTGIDVVTRGNGTTIAPKLYGMVHAQGRMLNRHQLNPIRGLNPVRLVGMLDESLRGIHADLQWCYSFLERREPMLRAVKERRLSALSRCSWSAEIDPKADDDSGLASLAEAQRIELEDLLSGIDNITEATKFLAIASFRGFSHLERVFENQRLVHLTPVPQWHWLQTWPSTLWQYNSDAMNTNRGEPINLDRWVIREVNDPINEAIAIEFLRKKVCQSDWDGFNETFGIPNIFGEAPESADQAWYNTNQATLEKIITGGRGFLPPGCKINISEASDASGAQFENRLRYCDQMIVVAGTGGKLTMLSDNTGIGKGPSEEHADVFDEIVAAEADEISECLQMSIGKKRLNAVFPGQPHMAYLRLSNPAMRVSLSGAQAVSTAKSAGFSIDPEIATEAIGMPVEESEDPPVTGANAQTTESEISNRAVIEGAVVQAFAGIANQNLHKFVRRITNAMEIEIDTNRNAELVKIRSEFPDMVSTLNRDTKLADFLEDIIGTEFLAGLAGTV